MSEEGCEEGGGEKGERKSRRRRKRLVMSEVGWPDGDSGGKGQGWERIGIIIAGPRRRTHAHTHTSWPCRAFANNVGYCTLPC